MKDRYNVKGFMVRKNYYIDTENVAYGCVDIILQARECDRIILFFSETSIQYGQLMEYCQKSKAHISHMTMRQSGSSAMDMLIMAMVVEDANRYPGKCHIILSNDNGYDSAIRIFNDRGYNIERRSCKALRKKEILSQKPISGPEKHRKIIGDFKTMKEYEKNLSEWHVIAGMSRRSRKLILKALDDTDDRYQLYYKLIEFYGREQGMDVYRAIKPYLNEIGR